MKLARNNDDLVEYMKKHGMVKTPAILEAFRAVDRGDFATPHLGQVCMSYVEREGGGKRREGEGRGGGGAGGIVPTPSHRRGYHCGFAYQKVLRRRRR